MKYGDGLLTLNALAKPRFLTLGEVEAREKHNFNEWKMRNDMVKRIGITKYRGFLCAGLDFVSGEQGVLYGHRSEANLGVILLWLAALFETPLDRQEQVPDLLDAFRETPIRVLHREDWGESMSDNTYIGHFMKDRFLKVSDLVMAGFVKKGAEE